MDLQTAKRIKGALQGCLKNNNNKKTKNKQKKKNQKTVGGRFSDLNTTGGKMRGPTGSKVLEHFPTHRA